MKKPSQKIRKDNFFQLLFFMEFFIKKFNKKLFILGGIFLFLVLIFGQMVLAKDETGDKKYRIKDLKLELKKKDSPENIPLVRKEGKEEKFLGRINVSDQYLISNISENEFLDEYPRLIMNFPETSISIESNEPIFNKKNFKQPFSFFESAKSFLGLKDEELSEPYRLNKELEKKPEGEIETRLDLGQISLTSRYQEKKAVVLGQMENPVKQDITIQNKSKNDLSLNLKVKTRVFAEKVVWEDKEYEITQTPRLFKAYQKTETIPQLAEKINAQDQEGIEEFENYTFTYQAGDYLFFQNNPLLPVGVYSWSDVSPELAPEVWVFKEGEETFFSLNVHLDLAAEASYTIDPNFSLWNSNYNLRYIGATGSNFLTRSGLPWGPYLNGVVVGDVTGDSVNDLILSSIYANYDLLGSGSVWVIQGGSSISQGTTTRPLSISDYYTLRFDGGAANQQIGYYSCLKTGDVNGDGLGDLIIPAPMADYNSKTNSGSVYVIYSTLIDDFTALPANQKVRKLASTSNYTIRFDGAAASDYLGYTCNLAVGDVNDDNYNDLVLGAEFADQSSLAGGLDSGAVFVFFSTLLDNYGNTGVYASGNNLMTWATNSNVIFLGSTGTARLSSWGSIAIGDVNGDSKEDLAIGEPSGDETRADSGSVFLMFSTMMDDYGVTTGTIATLSDRWASVSFNVRYSGASGTDNFFYPRIGDVNGDGKGDLVVAASNSDLISVANVGALYIFFSTLLDDFGTGKGATRTATSVNCNLIIFGSSAADAVGGFGNFLIGDVNGDNKGDLVIGTELADIGGANRGAVWVLFSTLIDDVGNTTGTARRLNASSNIIITGNANTIYLSYRGAMQIGDVNGDGLGDLIMGTYQSDNSATDSGSVWVILSTLMDDWSGYGQVKGLGTAANYNFRYDEMTAYDYLSIDSSIDVGDVNNDGATDLILGAGLANYTGNDYGAAYVILSKPTTTYDLVKIYASKDIAPSGLYWGDELAPSHLSKVVTDDNVYLQTATSVTNAGYDSQMFIFQSLLGYSPNNPKYTVNWSGYGDSTTTASYKVYMYLWNTTSQAWATLTSEHLETEGSLTGVTTTVGWADTNNQYRVWLKADNWYSAPVITATGIANLATYTVNITWTTDDPSSGEVGYNTSSQTAYKRYFYYDSDEGEWGTNHNISLALLPATTTHYYMMQSINADGEIVTSVQYSFKTLSKCVYLFTLTKDEKGREKENFEFITMARFKEKGDKKSGLEGFTVFKENEDWTYLNLENKTNKIKLRISPGEIQYIDSVQLEVVDRLKEEKNLSFGKKILNFIGLLPKEKIKKVSLKESSTGFDLLKKEDGKYFTLSDEKDFKNPKEVTLTFKELPKEDPKYERTLRFAEKGYFEPLRVIVLTGQEEESFGQSKFYEWLEKDGNNEKVSEILWQAIEKHQKPSEEKPIKTKENFFSKIFKDLKIKINNQYQKLTNRVLWPEKLTIESPKKTAEDFIHHHSLNTDFIRLLVESMSAPTVGTVILNLGAEINLTENSTTTVLATTTITDTNNATTITQISGKIYRSGLAATSTCSADANNCYSPESCVTSTVSQTAYNVTCTYRVWFHADPTDVGTYSSENWRAFIAATDSDGLRGSSSNSGVELNSLQAFNFSNLFERRTGRANATTITNVNNFNAQAFKIGYTGKNQDFKVTGARIHSYKAGAFTNTTTVSIMAVDVDSAPTGTDLTRTANLNSAYWGFTSGWTFYSFSPPYYTLSSNTAYAVVFKGSAGIGSGGVILSYSSSSDTYPDFDMYHSTNQGGNWSKYSASDILFEIYGENGILNYGTLSPGSSTATLTVPTVFINTGNIGLDSYIYGKSMWQQ